MRSFISPHFYLGQRRIVLLAIWAATLTSSSAEPTPAAPPYAWESKVWRQSSELLVDDALGNLPSSRSAGSDAERRQLAYTRAVLLLNSQPKLQGNIDQSHDLLESIRQTRADDELGLSALYYLARIAHLHADPRDPARAVALYTELIKRSPGHPLAQEAVAKLATIRLFEDTSPEEKRTRFAEFEAAATRLQAPAARRDLHFVLAEALLLLSDDREAVLRHLIAAEEAGIQRQQLTADTLARIAVLARDLGHRDIAVVHYKRFLSKFQRDVRSYMLGEQLKALEAQAPPAQPPVLAPEPVPSPAPVPVSSAAPLEPAPTLPAVPTPMDIPVSTQRPSP